MLTLGLMELQLELSLQLCVLIELLQYELVLLKELSGVFSALRELLLQRKVDIMSLLQLEKNEKPRIIRQTTFLVHG